MPSLRRTFSSPSVRSARSAPYPSIGMASATRTNGHVPRRTSGSETVSRRVLADIEWWRVLDGQREVDQESAEDENQGQGPDDVQDVPDDATVVAPSDEMARLSIGSPDLSPLMMADSMPGVNSDVVPVSPTSGFRAQPLAIAPVTPRHGRRRNTLQSPSSSTESTPESFRSYSLALPDVFLGPAASGHAGLTPLRLPSYPVPSARARPLSSVRTFSYNDLDCGRFSDEALQSVVPSNLGGAGFVDPFF
ncbi:hypothetical protein NEOLEDRAFT_1147404 [Neolentinus lepideus HHB14362 ss-1]|uniref:Uncharacterized protein n=1 Tax=Neolentinus lepideus HHB14362 ss-1 TaxID=1314782 RepID=A0A165TA85_9AGAM|nr:hypothetical protein NEOLEDRAFT_1147404 [Neolentinus lepideus HHB14362 ss-1]